MRFGAAGFGLALLALGFIVPAYQQPSVQKPTAWVSFSKDVAPVFKAACISCHAGKNSAAGLDLTNTTKLLNSGLIKAGDPEHSVLLRRIKGLDGLPQMPMGFKPIDPQKMRLLEKWIKGGAKLDQINGKHWSYISPVKPVIPIIINPTITYGLNISRLFFSML